jgi:ribosomal protein S18 acetylase RimI-like enzyme
MIRRAFVEDVPAVEQCETEHPRVQRWSIHRYLDLGAVCYVATPEPEFKAAAPVVGAVWVREYRGRLETVSLTVLRDYRGQGYASELMTFAHAWGDSRRLRKAFLDVCDDNLPARALYTALGYRNVGRPRAGVLRMQVDL